MASATYRICVLAGLSLCLAAPAARAQEVRYPTSLERQPLLDWLKRETDIAPDQVVAVSSSAVTAVVSSYPLLNPPGLKVSVRAEALTANATSRAGVVSWQTSMDLDCRGRRIKVGATTGYLDRNLLGQPLTVSPGDSDWRPPVAGTQLENVWRAFCERGNFQRPLAGEGAAQLSRADTQPAPAASTPSAPPRNAEPAPREAPKRTAPPAPPQPRVVAPAAVQAARVAVQVVASPNEAEAVGTATRLRDRFTLPGRILSARANEVKVEGRTFYRGLVSGFSSREEAVAWCGRLKAAGQACLIR